MMLRSSFALALALLVSGCGGSDRPSGGDAGAFDAAGVDSGARDSGGPRDAASVDAPEGPSACVLAGGVCGCAGGCNPGFHPAPAPLLDMCPQPCDTCGACSQECCLPDDAGVPRDAGMSGGPCTSTSECGAGLCIHPCCGGAGPPCVPLPDGGACPAGSTPCTSGGTPGCQTPCTPPPSYCDDTLPPGCMVDGTGNVICLCA